MAIQLTLSASIPMLTLTQGAFCGDRGLGAQDRLGGSPFGLGGPDGCGCDQRMQMMRQLEMMEPLLDMLGLMMSMLSMFGGQSPFSAGSPFQGGPAPYSGGPAPFAGGPTPFNSAPAPFNSGAPAFNSSPAPFNSNPTPPVNSSPPAPANPPRRAQTPPPANSGHQSSGMKAGAPPGYKAMTGRIPPEVTARARSLLSQPMGSEHPFEVNGKRYLARLENHYHPPGYQGGPNGWHKGCTVYEAV